MKTHLVVGHGSGIDAAQTGSLLERGDAVIGVARRSVDLHHPRLRSIQADVLNWDGGGLLDVLDGFVHASAATSRSMHWAPLSRCRRSSGHPEDVVRAGLALLDNPWITGQVLGVDGGMSALRP